MRLSNAVQFAMQHRPLSCQTQLNLSCGNAQQTGAADCVCVCVASASVATGATTTKWGHLAIYLQRPP